MKDLLEKWKNGLKGDNKRFFKFLAIPLAVILLIIIVVAVEKSGTEDTKPEHATLSEGQPVEEENAGESEKAEVTLQEEAIPEIHDLMLDYFKARKTCDLSGLEKVYGGTYTKEQLSEQIAKLEEEVKFYQSFENLVCYTAPGVSDGEYLVYAMFDIKFRQAETLAPSLIVCYAKKAEDGSIYLVGNTSQDQSQYMEEANQSEAVQAIAKKVNSGLEKALKSDENLLAVYHTLMGEEEATEETDGSSGPDLSIDAKEVPETESQSNNT